MPAGLKRAHLMGCSDMVIGWKLQEPAVGHGWRSRVPEHATCWAGGEQIAGRKKHTKARERQRERIRMGAERSLLGRSVYRRTGR